MDSDSDPNLTVSHTVADVIPDVDGNGLVITNLDVQPDQYGHVYLNGGGVYDASDGHAYKRRDPNTFGKPHTGADPDNRDDWYTHDHADDCPKCRPDRYADTRRSHALANAAGAAR